jgi:hypothetical protein
VFAPLVRDGRMDKFYWQPTLEDLVGILFQVGGCCACCGGWLPAVVGTLLQVGGWRMVQAVVDVSLGWL